MVTMMMLIYVTLALIAVLTAMMLCEAMELGTE
jgi:hypothetical protein